MMDNHLSMEVGEEATLCRPDKRLDLVLKAEPLELGSDQLVARHHRIHGVHPISG